jgi:small subunit ribosomal protein S6
MLREYELTIVINSQLPEEETKKLHKKYEGILLQEGGEVIKKSHWGNKKLSYPVKKHFRGNFVHYDFTTMPNLLAEAERLMRIDENVLRYLSIRIGENVTPAERKAPVARMEARAARADL